MVTACHVVSNSDYSATFEVTVTVGNNWQFAGDNSHSGDTATYTVRNNPMYMHAATDGSYDLQFTVFSVTRPTGNIGLAIEKDFLPGNLVRSSPCPNQSVQQTPHPIPTPS